MLQTIQTITNHLRELSSPPPHPLLRDLWQRTVIMKAQGKLVRPFENLPRLSYPFQHGCFLSVRYHAVPTRLKA